MFSECIAGSYGENCNNSCGHCLNETACDHVTGICDVECDPGYQTPYCTEGEDFCHKTFNKYYICLKL